MLVSKHFYEVSTGHTYPFPSLQGRKFRPLIAVAPLNSSSGADVFRASLAPRGQAFCAALQGLNALVPCHLLVPVNREASHAPADPTVLMPSCPRALRWPTGRFGTLARFMPSCAARKWHVQTSFITLSLGKGFSSQQRCSPAGRRQVGAVHSKVRA